MAVKNWGFCDLSIDKTFDLEKLSFLNTLGYHTVALNTYVEEANDEPKKKKKKGEVREKQDAFPAPVAVSSDVKTKSKLNILQRLTIEFSDSSIAHKMNQSENIKLYDIIAVVPKTLQAFQYACGTMDTDMISFDPSVKMPFKLSRKLYRQAVDRGVFFELSYSAVIKDSTARKNIISTAHVYHAIGKSKNIIVSSCADNLSFLRGVYDVINLGLLFGLSNLQSLESIRNNPRRLILKSLSRKCGRLYIEIDMEDKGNKIMLSYFLFYLLLYRYYKITLTLKNSLSLMNNKYSSDLWKNTK